MIYNTFEILLKLFNKIIKIIYFKIKQSTWSSSLKLKKFLKNL